MLLFGIPAIAWLLFSAVFFALGEFLSKEWGMYPSLGFAVIIALVYGIGGFFWLPALLSRNELAVMGTAWEVLAAITTIAIGLFIFREHLSGLQWSGIFLALAGLTLIWTG